MKKGVHTNFTEKSFVVKFCSEFPDRDAYNWSSRPPPCSSIHLSPQHGAAGYLAKVAFLSSVGHQKERLAEAFPVHQSSHHQHPHRHPHLLYYVAAFPRQPSYNENITH